MRKFILLMLLGMFAFTAKSQNVVWEWKKSFSVNNDSNRIYQLLTDNQFIYGVGVFFRPVFSYGSDTIFNKGGRDIFITKWDTSGNMIWLKSIGGDSSDIVSKVMMDAQGNMTFGINTKSDTINFNGQSIYTGGKGFLMMKTNANGNLIWNHHFGNIGDTLTSICLGINDTIYAAGKIAGNSGVFKIRNDGSFQIKKSYVNPPDFLMYSKSDSCLVYKVLNDSLNHTYFVKTRLDTSNKYSLQSDVFIMAAAIESLSGNLYYIKLNLSSGIGCCYYNSKIIIVSSSGTITDSIFTNEAGQWASFSPIAQNDSLFAITSISQYTECKISLLNKSTKKYVYRNETPDFNFLGTWFGETPSNYHTIPLLIHSKIFVGGVFQDIYGNTFYALGKISTEFIPYNTNRTLQACLGTPIQLYTSTQGGMPPIQYQWSPTTGLSNPNSKITTASVDSNITYTINMTDANGNIAIDTIRVLVDSGIIPQISASDTILCNGNSTITLSSNVTSGFWYFGNSLIGINQTININKAGTYIYNVNSACSTFTDSLLIHNVLPPPTLNVSPTNYICQGEMVQLNASGALFYTWSGGVQNGVPFTCPLTNTIYTVVASDANGCTNSKMVSIIVKPAPIITAHTTDSIVCPGTGTILYGEGGGNYYNWSGGVTNNKVFYPTHSATYYVSGSGSNGCNGKDSIFIQVDSLPMVIANATDSVICFGESIQLIGEGALTYIWSGGIEDKEIIIPEVTSTYYVTGTDANGCVSHSSIKIYVNPLPEASIGFTPPNHLMTSSSGIYQWYFNNQPVPLSGPNYTDYIGNGIYQVLVTDSNGCESLSQPYLAHITEDWYVTPNPFTDELLLTLHIPENEIISCTLFDGLGNIIKKTPDQFDVLKGLHVYHFTHLDNLPHGVYFLQVILSEERRVFKVVK